MSQDGQTEALNCTYGDTEADRSIALIGGSHAEHWLPALDELGHKHRFRVETYVKVDARQCSRRTGRPRRRMRGVDVRRSRRGGRLAPRHRVQHLHPSPPGCGRDYTPDTYLALWQALTDLDLPTIVVRDTPWLESDGVAYRASDCLARRGGNADTCGIDRRRPSTDRSRAGRLGPFPTVFPLDLSDAVCREDRCRVIEGNVQIYRDSNHLTASYVRTLTPVMEDRLGPLTGWWSDAPADY